MIFSFTKNPTMRRYTFFSLLLAALIAVPVAGSFGADAELTPDGKQTLEEEWLFQADRNITIETLHKELLLSRQLIERLAKLPGAPAFDEETKALDEIQRKIDSVNAETIRELYFRLRNVKRNAFFKNPLVDFDRVLLIDNPYPKGKRGDATDEWGHEARHRNGFMAVHGGRLLSVGLQPGSEVKNILPQLNGAFWRPDLSYDAKKILFSYQPENERSFHLYECNIDGSDVKQLTFGDYDDLDPVYSPDGKIVFCSSRQHSYVRCMPMTHSFALSRCDADGKNIYVISANGEPEYLPSILNDGRVIYTRWEYTDKALWRIQSLWTVNPDGTNPQIFWGNQSIWPDVLTEARAIPNSSKVMFTAVGHHAWFNGSIGIIDPAAGLDYPNGLNRVTREVEWPEVGNGPQDPPPTVDYQPSGKINAYKTPYPLSEEYFLVSAREGDNLYSGPHNDWYFRLYLMDIYGNKELIYRGKHNAYHAIPIRSRVAPPMKPDMVDWPEIGSGRKPSPGVLYSNNVFENVPEILKKNGKAIRVIQMDPKTYSTWVKIVQHDGPAVSVFQAEGVKRILGTTPIEPDGSIAFEVPPGEAFYMEMLDAEGRAIHTMRTFTNVMPGEIRGCFGCHETQMKMVGNKGPETKMGIALRRGARPLVPPSWGTGESIGYKRFVQPVLDKYCADCHQNPQHEAYAKLNMIYRPSTHGWWAWAYNQHDVSPFYEPYYTLVSGATPWGRAKKRNELNVPANLAGVFVVEAYGGNDPASVKTLPPYSVYSAVSPLVHNAISGEHHGVKVEGIDRERLIAWVDCNGPFLGDEEIRNEMYDPAPEVLPMCPPIRPRVATAPRINRFDVRQDGNTAAMFGELKLMSDRKPNYDPNHALREYRKEVFRKQFEHEKDLKIEILDATYGSDSENKRVSVLDRLKQDFNGTRYIPLESYNEAFGDPAYGTVKDLKISYTINGGEPKQAVFKENAPIVLPKK